MTQSASDGDGTWGGLGRTGRSSLRRPLDDCREWFAVDVEDPGWQPFGLLEASAMARAVRTKH